MSATQALLVAVGRGPSEGSSEPCVGEAQRAEACSVALRNQDSRQLRVRPEQEAADGTRDPRSEQTGEIGEGNAVAATSLLHVVRGESPGPDLVRVEHVEGLSARGPQLEGCCHDVGAVVHVGERDTAEGTVYQDESPEPHADAIDPLPAPSPDEAGSQHDEVQIVVAGVPTAQSLLPNLGDGVSVAGVHR